MNSIVEWLLNLSPGGIAGGDWRIGFISDYNNYVKLALLVVAGGLIWWTVRSYRREGQTSRNLKAILATIRILVIALVLAILFQPAVIVRVSETLYSSVLVLIDDSMSMSFRDRYAETAQDDVRGGLAEKLGISETDLAGLSRMEILKRQLAAPDGVMAKLNKDHPIELIRFSTDRPGQASYTNVLGSIPLDSSPSDPQRLPEALPTTRPGDLESMLGRLRASGYETNHSAAIRDALDRLRGRRIGAMVMLGDGQPTDPDAADRLAAAVEYAEQRGVPRFTVMFGDPTPPQNIAITTLRAPREVRVNSKTLFTAMLHHRNLENESVEVRLYRRKAGENFPDNLQDTPPIIARTVKLIEPDDPEADGRGKGVQSVKIEFVPKVKEHGEYVYRVLIPRRRDELTGEDNHADAFVKVSDDKTRILLISGDSGWEFRYIRNYFLRQPELYRLSVWQQDADVEVNQSASSGMKLTRLPRSLRELIDTARDGDSKALPPPKTTLRPPEGAQPTVAKDKSGEAKDKPGETKVEAIPPGYHVVILYDPSPTKGGFDEKFINLLYDFVTIHRGGLCYIASNSDTYEVLRDPAAKKL
ncbi:MAG: VWA domain-containing protein, partial [Candidatus Hydrogenedentes bacterium]|nr:VWA domain-containing protein [Candidatus Hydrogenedentota bacterium]